MGSRRRAKELIDATAVQLPGLRRPAKAGQVLEPGQWVEVELLPVPPPPTVAEVADGVEPLRVLHADPFLVVIDKRPGIAAHPPEGARNYRTPTVATLAEAAFGPLPRLGGDDRPGIVHRLDKDTSGVMLIARTEEAFHFLQSQFKARTIEKEYRCLSYGEARFESDWMEGAIADHPTRADRMQVVREGGREAVTWLVLRVYTSRLLGASPTLVLHGGGNTSVKTCTRRRPARRVVDVLCVKGSGSDLARSSPQGLPAVRLQPLRELRALATRSTDEAMVDADARRACSTAEAPNPSVETLLHAFLPHKFVDHTHADAILVLTDQPEPDRGTCARRSATTVVVLPWIMPGLPAREGGGRWPSSKRRTAAASCSRSTACSRSATTARESYERTIELVDRAERYIAHASSAGAAAMLLGDRRRCRAPSGGVARQALPVVRGGALAWHAADAVGRCWRASSPRRAPRRPGARSPRTRGARCAPATRSRPTT
jgi:hypothetical protein